MGIGYCVADTGTIDLESAIGIKGSDRLESFFPLFEVALVKKNYPT